MTEQMIPETGPPVPVRGAEGVRAVRPYVADVLSNTVPAAAPSVFVPTLPAAPSARAELGSPVADVAGDPVDRVLHGYLGRCSRFALANSVSAWMDLDDDTRRVLPTSYVAAQDQALAALRVGAVDEPPVVVTADGVAYLWLVPCLDCGAEAERACMGVPSALHVHTARVLSVLLVVVADQPYVVDLVDQAQRLVRARGAASVPAVVASAGAVLTGVLDEDLAGGGR